MATALPKSKQWKLGTLAILPYDVDVANNVTVGGTLVVTGAITATAGITGTGVVTDRVARATVAATGTTVTDAAQLAKGFTSVTAADGTKGVKLPATPVAGTLVFVKNTAAAILKVWPDAAATVNAIGTNGAISMAASTSAVFIADSTTQWYTIPLLPS